MTSPAYFSLQHPPTITSSYRLLTENHASRSLLYCFFRFQFQSFGYEYITYISDSAQSGISQRCATSRAQTATVSIRPSPATALPTAMTARTNSDAVRFEIREICRTRRPLFLRRLSMHVRYELLRLGRSSRRASSSLDASERPQRRFRFARGGRLRKSPRHEI